MWMAPNAGILFTQVHYVCNKMNNYSVDTHISTAVRVSLSSISGISETQFGSGTNYVQMSFSKTLTALVYQGFQIQNGGELNLGPILSK